MNRRAFVAIGIPPSVRDDLAAATAGLRGTGAGPRGADPGLRTTAPAGWHLTLAFLGALDEARVASAATVTARALEVHASRPAPWLRLADADRFGDRVLYAHVHSDPPAALAGLAEGLRGALMAAGFVLPASRFRPHVTLARSRRARPVTGADVAGLVVPARRWQPDAVGLLAAAGPDAPRPYEVLAELAWPSGSASPGETGGC